MSACSGHDGINLDFGKMLAMPLLEAIALAAFLFEDDDLVAFDVVCNDGGVYPGAVQYRRAYAYLAVSFHQEHLVEAETVTFGGFKLVDEDLLTFLDFELLTSYGYDCEHLRLV